MWSSKEKTKRFVIDEIETSNHPIWFQTSRVKFSFEINKQDFINLHINTSSRQGIEKNKLNVKDQVKLISCDENKDIDKDKKKTLILD